MEMILKYVEYMIFSIHEILFEMAESFSRYMIFGSRCSRSVDVRCPMQCQCSGMQNLCAQHAAAQQWPCVHIVSPSPSPSLQPTPTLPQPARGVSQARRLHVWCPMQCQCPPMHLVVDVVSPPMLCQPAQGCHKQATPYGASALLCTYLAVA
jgi:hypothetical protein